MSVACAVESVSSTATKPLHESDSEKKARLARQTMCKFIHLTVTSGKAANYRRLVSELDFSSRYKPESAKQWYEALAECVSFLSFDKGSRDLWTSIFDKFRWDFGGDTLVAYCRFCSALVGRHPSALKAVVTAVVCNLGAAAKSGNEQVAIAHRLFQDLSKVRPTVSAVLFQALVDAFPNCYRSTEEWMVFSQQLFAVMHYMPELSDKLLQLLIERLILLDMTSRRRGVLESGASHSMVDTMDAVMALLFEYIRIIARNEKQLSGVFRALLRTFEQSMLSAVELRNVQYLVFYTCHFRLKFGEEFIARLLQLITDTSVPSFERCAAAAYCGGFVAKAQFVRQHTAFHAFEILVHWSAAYARQFASNNPLLFLTAADSPHKFAASSKLSRGHLSAVISSTDARSHVLFYAVCQSLFGVYADHWSHFDERCEQLQPQECEDFEGDGSAESGRRHGKRKVRQPKVVSGLNANDSDVDSDADEHMDGLSDDDSSDEWPEDERRHKHGIVSGKETADEKVSAKVSQIRSDMRAIIESPLAPLRFMKSALSKGVCKAMAASTLFGRSLDLEHARGGRHIDWHTFSGAFAKLQSEPFSDYSLPKSGQFLNALVSDKKKQKAAESEAKAEDVSGGGVGMAVDVDMGESEEMMTLVKSSVKAELALTPSLPSVETDAVRMSDGSIAGAPPHFVLDSFDVEDSDNDSDSDGELSDDTDFEMTE